MSQREDLDQRYASAQRMVEALYERREAGESVDLERLIAARPNLEPELRELWCACGEVEQALQGARDSAAAQRAQVEQALAELAAQPDFAARYTIEGEVGQGGMGAVYRVRDRKLDRPVAMKVILGQAHPGRSGKTLPIAPRQLARFLNEARITSQLDHPGIVPVHELGVDAQGRAFFTMKLVKGRTLTEIFELRAQNDSQWSRARVLGIIERACEALAFAHERGVIHRDLKPANVMIGDFGEVYVMDWGLARRLSAGPETGRAEWGGQRMADRALCDQLSLTQDGHVLGTPAYMPPEQALGRIEAMGPHSDVYAIGAMLYQLITGHAPYCGPGESTTASGVLECIKRGPPKPLATRRIPPELIAICEKAMARERSARYRNMVELSVEIAAYTAGRVVRAHAVGAWAETRKWIWRNRSLALSLAGGAITLVAGLASVAAVLAHGRQQEIERGYLANISAAQSNLQANQCGEARRRLAACGQDLRGWEWRHLHLQSDTSLDRCTGLLHEVLCLSFSPDGSRVFAGLRSGGIGVWDLRAREFKLLALDPGVVYGIGVSPDGKLLATGSATRTIRIWDASTGEHLQDLNGHARGLLSVAFSPDGSCIASAADDNNVRVWDVRTGSCLATLVGHTAAVRSAAFSPDGSHIVSGSDDRTVRIWDIGTGASFVLRGHTAEVRSVAFSPDGLRIASCSDDRTVRTWDARTGENLLAMQGHVAGVCSVAYSPDGSLVVSGSLDKSVRVWDAGTGQTVAIHRGNEGPVLCVAFDKSGSRIASGSSDGALMLWDPKTSAVASANGVRGNLRSVALNRDGTLIAAGTTEPEIWVWDAQTGEIQSVLLGHTNEVSAVAFDPATSNLLSASVDGTVRTWNPRTGVEIEPARCGVGVLRAAAFSPDGSSIAVGNDEGIIRVWHQGESDAQAEQFQPKGWSCASLAFSFDGSLLALAGTRSDEQPEGPVAFVHDMRTGNVTELPVPRSTVQAVAFENHGSRLALGGDDTKVRVFEGRTGRCLHVLDGHESRVNCLAFSHDDARLASGDKSGTIRIWDTQTCQCVAVLREQEFGQSEPSCFVNSVAFGRDDSLLVSGSDDGYSYNDGRVLLWETLPVAGRAERRASAGTELAAAHLVADPLFEQGLSAAELITRIEADLTIEPGVRKASIRLARREGDDPDELCARSWRITRACGNTPAAYVQALRLAERACKIKPERTDLRVFSGAALYRTGQFGPAIEVLTQALAFEPDNPGALAFRIMAQRRHGEVEGAAAELLRLENSMQEKPRRIEYEHDYRRLCCEAKTLLESSLPAASTSPR